MKVITSTDNAQFKALKSAMQSARERRQLGVFVCEGIHLANAARLSGFVPEHTFVAQSALGPISQVDPVEPVNSLAQINSMAQVNRTAAGLSVSQSQVLAELNAIESVSPITVFGDALFRAVSTLEQGVSIIQVHHTPSPVFADVIEQCNVKQLNAIYLEHIQDPGNLGTVLRSAAAAGCNTVICSPQCVDVWSPKVLRAGMGAHFALNVFENIEFDALLKAWSGAILATSLQASTSIYQTNLSQPILWCFGHEGQGLSMATQESIRSHPKGDLVHIPQAPAVESLNISAAAAVCLFEQKRRYLDNNIN